MRHNETNKREDKKMKKAKFIGKWLGSGFDRDSVYLEYE